MNRDSLFKSLDEVEDALRSTSPKVSSYKKYVEKKNHLLKLIEKSYDKKIHQDVSVNKVKR